MTMKALYVSRWSLDMMSFIIVKLICNAWWDPPKGFLFVKYESSMIAGPKQALDQTFDLPIWLGAYLIGHW